MKLIKLLLSISFLFLITNELCAQNILGGSKFLYLTYRGGSKTSVSFEQINKTFTGSVHVYKFANHIILEKDDRVYYIDKNDTVLYYDYSLRVGDTFYFNHSPIRTEYITIDSIKMIQFNDEKYYKHWYLKSKFQAKPIIWVEGFGEKNMGWYAYDLIAIHSTKLKSICQFDTLRFWDTAFNGFEPDIVTPTCDYVSLLQRNSHQVIKTQRPEISPNPANKELMIKGFGGSRYEIYNLIGKNIENGILYESINCNSLAEGTYVLRLISDKGSYTIKFIKNN